MQFTFPETRHDRGRLDYVGPIPVLQVEGTPEQMGAQAGELALQPAARILDYPFDLAAAQLKSRSLARLVMPHLDRLGRRLISRFPNHHRLELLSLAERVHDQRRVVRGNTLFDLKNLQPWRMFGCSSIAMGATRTDTGGPLMGRNLDFFPLGYLHEFGLVTVVRSTVPGLRPFAAIGFPGSVGVFSGMNNAGLAVATHEVFNPPDRRYNSAGEPFALTCRRVLEECTSVDEAEALFRATPRTTTVSVAVCGLSGQAVFELSPKDVRRRDSIRDAVICVNHFLGQSLGGANPFNTLGRLDRLSQVVVDAGPLGVRGVWSALNAVGQAQYTVQSIVFEPRRLAIHVALGLPATCLTPTELTLADYF